ncbi:hypothetical protein QS257_11100 [Terrilactibacillus sp. S3-3]|nr:hypothetical protein QS257_11100 [Terrilactibacillus sp. S3-3]
MMNHTTARKRTASLLLTMIFFFVAGTYPVHAQTDLSKLIIKTHKIENTAELIRTSDVIVEAVVPPSWRKVDTHTALSANQHLYNYVQRLTVKQTFKGTPLPPVQLLTTGIEPLPRPRDPLNLIYTGPLADGNYVLCLKKISHTAFYALNGGFQAVYPIYGGRTIHLLKDKEWPIGAEKRSTK